MAPQADVCLRSQDVELIAAKTYSRGIVLHSVLFNNSLYAVLADADDDQPLLDVAFPDVTARCRGLQIKSYDLAAAESGLVPRKLSLWEGRRRGAVGVGWGTAAALAAGGAAIAKDGSITGGLKKVKVKKGRGESKTAAAAGASSSKEADDDAGSDGKAAEEAAEAAAAAAATARRKAAAEAAAARRKAQADAAARAARAASSGKTAEAPSERKVASDEERKVAGGGGAGAGSPHKKTGSAGMSRAVLCLRFAVPEHHIATLRRFWRARPTSHCTARKRRQGAAFGSSQQHETAWRAGQCAVG